MPNGTDNLNQLADHLNAMRGTLRKTGETEEEILDAVEELADRMEPEAGAEGAPEAGEEPGDPMASIRGLLDKGATEDAGRAVGDIGDRRMVVMPENTQLDILGVLRDIALIGLPFRGIATKAIGSKL